MIYFLDLEASSLLPGGFPIELPGWTKRVMAKATSSAPQTPGSMKTRIIRTGVGRASKSTVSDFQRSLPRAFPTTTSRGALPRSWRRQRLSCAPTASSSVSLRERPPSNVWERREDWRFVA